MDKNVVILGAQGFVGSFLVPTLKTQGITVFCPEIDIRNFDQVKTTFAEIRKIDVLVLLAGISSPAEAAKDQAKLYQVNVSGVINVTKALQDTHPRAHIIFTSTAQVYMVANEENYISEQSPVKPQNEYALSKILAEDVLTRFMQINTQSSCSILRVFNHTHSQQPGNLFVPSVVRQLKQAKDQGQTKTKIKVGNVEIIRDFSPVQNLVSSIQLLVKSSGNQSGLEIYNICSGTGLKLKDLIVSIAKHFSLEVELEIDRGLFRPGEPRIIVGQNQKILDLYKKDNSSPQNAIELIYA